MAFSRSENKGVFSTEVSRVIRATCVGPTRRRNLLVPSYRCEGRTAAQPASPSLALESPPLRQRSHGEGEESLTGKAPSSGGPVYRRRECQPAAGPTVYDANFLSPR